jgi:hypothetical protein
VGVFDASTSRSDTPCVEQESPDALRLYAEALLRKADELDADLLPHTEVVDWLKRLRGEDGAFTCTAYLYDLQSDCLKAILNQETDGGGQLHQVRDEVIPPAWR